jgi:hypothetical protein
MFGVAVALVAAMFYAFYRSLRALGWVAALQGFSILFALVIGRVAFGALNVISIAFAAILLGVGMDYFILVYHHFGVASTAGAKHWPLLRRGIWLSSLTTASAFGVLALSSFPGLRQLAVLIAAGLVAAAYAGTELVPPILQRRPPRVPAWLTVASDRFAADRAAAAFGRTVAALLIAAIGLSPVRRHQFIMPACTRCTCPQRRLCGLTAARAGAGERSTWWRAATLDEHVRVGDLGCQLDAYCAAAAVDDFRAQPPSARRHADRVAEPPAARVSANWQATIGLLRVPMIGRRSEAPRSAFADVNGTARRFGGGRGLPIARHASSVGHRSWRPAAWSRGREPPRLLAKVARELGDHDGRSGDRMP